MAYVLVVDNHGNEVARFHHTDLLGREPHLPPVLRKAVDQAIQSDARHAMTADDEMRPKDWEQALAHHVNQV